jgi:hypothetical protein
MMRACGATAGNMLSSTSQLTHRGSSAVPTFLHQLSSGCAPIPCTATISTGSTASAGASRSILSPMSSSVTSRTLIRVSLAPLRFGSVRATHHCWLLGSSYVLLKVTIKLDDNEQRSNVENEERSKGEDQAEAPGRGIRLNADKAKAAGTFHPLVARLST